MSPKNKCPLALSTLKTTTCGYNKLKRTTTTTARILFVTFCVCECVVQSPPRIPLVPILSLFVLTFSRNSPYRRFVPNNRCATCYQTQLDRYLLSSSFSIKNLFSPFLIIIIFVWFSFSIHLSCYHLPK